MAAKQGKGHRATPTRVVMVNLSPTTSRARDQALHLKQAALGGSLPIRPKMDDEALRRGYEVIAAELEGATP